VSDAGRLLGWFESGELVRPDATAPNLIDLSLAMAHLCGVEDIELTSNGRAIAEAIGASDHYVFVLLDGFGMHLAETLRPDDPLSEHLLMELRTVFPTSTAPALTSLATGAWPAEHAVPGWWTHLPEAALTSTILPFAERFSERPLSEFGLLPGGVFPTAVLPGRYRRQCLWVSPKTISGSVYSRYSSAEAARFGYRSLAAAVSAVVDHITSAPGPTYTYVYVPFIDTAEHEHGPESGQTKRALDHARARLRTLMSSLEGRARIVVTADHGQIERGERVIFDRADPLMKMLVAPPSCEPRAAAFHVQPRSADAFASGFRARYGDRFALLTIDEVDELRLLGPMPLSNGTRRRLGDMMAIPRGREAILYEPKKELLAMRGFHGGLLPHEVRVPLIVA
jgi:hypothetical protein